MKSKDLVKMEILLKAIYKDEHFTKEEKEEYVNMVYDVFQEEEVKEDKKRIRRK